MWKFLTLLTIGLFILPSVSFAGLGGGLVGYWPMDSRDKLTSTTIIDRSGQGNNGTLVNSPTSVAGKIGQALSFNGSSQYVDLGQPSALNLQSSNAFTLLAWVYPTSNPYGSGVISTGYPSTVQYELGFSISDPPNTNSFTSSGYYDGSWHLATDNVNIPLNKWVFISGTFDGAKLTVYKNGVQVGQTNSSNSLPILTGNIKIGDRHDHAGAVNFFPGYIDDVRIYNRTLSASEVKNVYRQEVSAHTGSWFSSFMSLFI